MKLTKSHMQAFIAAVMDDVPVHDYNADFEKLVFADMLTQAPKEVAVLLLDPKLKGFVLTGSSAISPDSYKDGNSYYPGWSVGLSSTVCYSDYKMSDDAKLQSTSIMARAVEQQARTAKLRSMVTSTINACTTLKQAHELLPEFAKYLPEETTKGTMLPAVANLAAVLIEAGWPKEAVAA